ncbi:MAG: hypothetical protein IJD43_08205 [Thermoguttaceae bacterium]|nr:hypothetical protein [Thermoguttaceae bacterium]
MPEITGIGANVFDTLVKVPFFPKEDTKLCVETVRTSGGGPVGTGLAAASKLGASAAVIAVLSTDPEGTFLRNDLEKYGVDTSLAEFRDGKSFSATVLLNCATGSRTCLLDRGTLPKLTLTDAHLTAIRSSRVFMADGNELDAAVEAAKEARKAGVHVLYDAGGLYPGVERLLPYADILIPSAEFACGSTKKERIEDAVRDLFSRFSPQVAVVTDGANGGILFDGNELRRYPAFPVQAVDSNGAGDVFHGAFAFALTRGWDFYRCAVFSSAVSALKCTKIGARAAVPTLEEVRVFLQERGWGIEGW